MNIQNFVVISLCALGLTPFNAFSANVSSIGQIERIYPVPASGGAVRFKLDNDYCDYVHSNHYYELRRDHESFEETYALMVASAYSSKSVSVRHDDAACSENVGVTDVVYIIQKF